MELSLKINKASRFEERHEPFTTSSRRLYKAALQCLMILQDVSAVSEGTGCIMVSVLARLKLNSWGGKKFAVMRQLPITFRASLQRSLS
jgi:hypothetical protein